MDLNQSHRRNNRSDEEKDESNDQQNQEFLESQNTTKGPESSQKNLSRPNSRAASAGQQLRSQSNPQMIKSWNSINPFINFMSDFRKMHQTGGKASTLMQLGGEEWRRMTLDQKQPYMDAATRNKKSNDKRPAQRSRRKRQGQNSGNEEQPRTSTDKDNAPNKSGSTRKIRSLTKRKGSQQKNERQYKKTRAKSDSETDTGTSVSIHTATTEYASEDSDSSY